MAAQRSHIALLLILAGLLLIVVSPWPTAASPAAPDDAVVAFVGNHVVDLAWDPVPAEWYEVTRNGVPAGCTPGADPFSGKIFCRDDGLASGETYTYLVEAVNGDERTTVGEQSATTGFVRGILYHNLDWSTPGETYSLDGQVLVTNGAVLTIGSNVGVDKWSSPSEAAGIQTTGTGGLQVTSASPPTTFNGIYLRLGAGADVIAGVADSPVPFDGVSMRLTNAALLDYCSFTRSSIEITEEGGVPSLTNSHFINVPIWVSATSSPVVFDNDRFGDPVLGDFWVHDGGQVHVSNSLFAASTGIGVEVGTNSIATLANNIFNITSSTGVLVWPGVGAEVTVTKNNFQNIAPDFAQMTGVAGDHGDRHLHALTGQNSTILVEDNIFTGQRSLGISSTAAVDLEARGNSFVQGSSAFRVNTTYDPDLELGSVRVNNNCIASRTGASLATTSAVNVDATGNWWGSASGPTVAGNPDGDGATITITGGNLTYDGWLREENCAVPWLNLTPRNMEAVQVVQTWDNQVPLVAGRPTVVRVYPGAYPGQTTDVSGELTVIRDGAQMGTLRPAAPRTVDYFLGLDVGTQLEYRSAGNNGLLFKVPGEWVSGVMTFTVELNADRAYEEYDYTDNFLSESYTTVEVAPVNVGIVPANYVPEETRSAGTAPSLEDTLELAGLFSRIYPGSEINLTLFPTLDWPHRLDGHGLNPKYRYVGGAFMTTLGLSQMRLAAEGGITGPPPDLVYGAISPEAWDFSEIYDSFYEPLWTSRAAVSYGKSYGHLFALRQLGFLGLWGVPAQRQADNDCYFYDVGYDVAQDRVVGYGHDTCRLSSSYPDITDPGRYWLAVDQYQNLLDYVPPATPSAPIGEQAYVAVLANVSGQDEVELLPAWQFTSGTPPHNPPTGGGAYCVELLDAGNATLSSHCFDLNITVGSLGWDHVLVTLPLTGEPERVAIRRGDTEIAEIPVTAHAPVVAIARGPQAPYSALAPDDTLSLRWAATDADGDGLEYSILVSSDDGATWLPVAANLDATTFDLDLSEIPAGSRLWVRVEASDGFNVGSAGYGPFSLANHTPEVLIHAPANGAVISPTASLSGFAYDREEGQLDGASLVWASSIDGELGTGPLVFSGALSEGRHTLTLTATDGAGASGTATVVVTVGDAPGAYNTLYLPLISGH